MARIHRRTEEKKTKTKTKNVLDPDNHNGVITHLEQDILQCKLKWAFGSITMNKTSGGHGIPIELLQILKGYAVKVMPSIWQQIWETQQWQQNWKISAYSSPKKDNAKECSNYCTIALISHASKILQSRLQQYMKCKLSDVQAWFRKGTETRS